MARKRSKVKTILILCVLGLAAFGGWTLWQKYSDDVNDAASKVSKRTKKVTKALSD